MYYGRHAPHGCFRATTINQEHFYSCAWLLCRYPALQWQLRAARRALAAVAAAGPWLRDRVGLTRYAHVPLAGLGRDGLMSIADVLMARRLREAGHVLWTADPALPDLGMFCNLCL